MTGKRRPPAPEPSLLVSRPRDSVLLLSLNRPGCRNALDLETVTAMHRMLNAETERVIVLTSSTPGTFCAGADLSVSDEERGKVSRALYRLYAQMIELPVPVIAALDGPAVGGGAQLAVAADLRVASLSAWFRFVGPGHGLAVGAWALPSLVGRGRAVDLCLTARRVDAAEALPMGLVDRVHNDPISAAVELGAALAGLDAEAVARTKEIVRLGAVTGAALALESEGNSGWQGAAPPARSRR